MTKSCYLAYIIGSGVSWVLWRMKGNYISIVHIFISCLQGAYILVGDISFHKLKDGVSGEFQIVVQTIL